MTSMMEQARHACAEGDEAAAERTLRVLLERLADAFDPELEARASLLLGELLVGRSEGAEARRVLENAVARSLEAGLPLVEAEAWYGLAMSAFDEGRSKDGHDALLEAMALYRGLDGDDARRGLARAVRAYGEHVAVLGGSAQAKEALTLAGAMYGALGDAAEVEGVASDAKDVDYFAR
ncbi:MAG: hypothetical protein RL199_440 [Pseudomonadota bacterium]|jgi:tetratricopeptide (TPR) repeat protein